MKRTHRARDLGEVVMSVRGGKLTLETVGGG